MSEVATLKTLVGVPLWLVLVMVFGVLPVLGFGWLASSLEARGQARLHAQCTALSEERDRQARIERAHRRCADLAKLDTTTDFGVFVERCMQEADKEEWRSP